MKVLAAYLLLVLGGNAAPSAADVAKLLSSSGVECDAAEVEVLVKGLEGKDLEELIAEGSKKVLVGGGGGGGGGGAAAAAGGAAEAKEEEEVVEAAEVDMGGGADLFGGGDGDGY